jgi:hypothetical protein
MKARKLGQTAVSWTPGFIPLYATVILNPLYKHQLMDVFYDVVDVANFPGSEGKLQLAMSSFNAGGGFLAKVRKVLTYTLRPFGVIE